jgi:uncharacterized protein (DUF3084 family)
MKILDLAKQIDDQFKSFERELQAKEFGLSTREQSLDERNGKLDTREDAVANREVDLMVREKKVAEIEGLDEKRTVLAQKGLEISVGQNENRKKENELAEMLAGIKQREAEVTGRETAVSERERTYKEKIEKEFFEEVKKRLPL